MDFFLFTIFASAIYYEAKILGKPDRLAWIYRMTDTSGKSGISNFPESN